MRIDKIIIPLIEKKITDPIKIFEDEELFKEILFWSRECNRERLHRHTRQKDLANKIDDIGPVVDKYLRDVRLKMLTSGKKGKNNLSYKLSSTRLTFIWIMQRWGNVLLNISTNRNYKSFIDVRSIGHELNNNTGHSQDSLSLIVEEENEREWEKQQHNNVKTWNKD